MLTTLLCNYKSNKKCIYLMHPSTAIDTSSCKKGLAKCNFGRIISVEMKNKNQQSDNNRFYYLHPWKKNTKRYDLSFSAHFCFSHSGELDNFSWRKITKFISNSKCIQNMLSHRICSFLITFNLKNLQNIINHRMIIHKFSFSINFNKSCNDISYIKWCQN